jgi:hypothetical protein
MNAIFPCQTLARLVSATLHPIPYPSVHTVAIAQVSCDMFEGPAIFTINPAGSIKGRAIRIESGILPAKQFLQSRTDAVLACV